MYLCGRDCRGWRQVLPPREKEGDFLLGLRLSPLPFSYQRAMERAPPPPLSPCCPPSATLGASGRAPRILPFPLESRGKEKLREYLSAAQTKGPCRKATYDSRSYSGIYSEQTNKRKTLHGRKGKLALWVKNDATWENASWGARRSPNPSLTILTPKHLSRDLRDADA